MVFACSSVPSVAYRNGIKNYLRLRTLPLCKFTHDLRVASSIRVQVREMLNDGRLLSCAPISKMSNPGQFWPVTTFMQ